MMNIKTTTSRLIFATLLSLVALIATVSGQQPQSKPTPPAQTDDVLRVNTELVQTDVMVFDKQGRFVDNLQRDQFELLVDGKPMPISFFEKVVAGSSREEMLRTGTPNAAAASTSNAAADINRGRTIVFFLDDLHLSLTSVENTRKMLLKFINENMGQNDLVAIASTSGQIGFLQQFTDNKAVLRAAVARLSYRANPIADIGAGAGAKMTEFIALTIDRRDDPKLYDFFVSECVKYTGVSGRSPRIARDAARTTCETLVKANARQILIQSAALINRTYDSLESLMRSSAQLPGRKLAFFLSDGFLLATGRAGSDPTYKLKRITDAAQRAGVVIYTIDTKGLVSGQPDATTGTVDPNGNLTIARAREVSASQDALNALAADTGGRALRNQNYYDKWVANVLQETSRYYVLAWRPENEEQRGERFRAVEVRVTGRPDLSVRLPRGTFNVAPTPPATDTKASDSKNEVTTASAIAAKVPENDLRTALTDFYSRGALPTVLSLNYLDTPANGMVLTASMQVATNVLSFASGDGKPTPATVDIAGVIINDQGKPTSSFKNRLSVAAPAENSATNDAGVIYNYRAPLKPGIYQVRVAARDSRSGIVGSAMQWIEVPDLSTRRLALSTLLIGGQLIGATAQQTSATDASAPQVQFSVDHHFRRTSHLNFWLFIYNAGRGPQGHSTPDLTAQVQVFRDGQSIVTTPPRKLSLNAATDMARIPYGGDFSLKALPAGNYMLQVTITDRLAQTSTTQSARFQVE